MALEHQPYGAYTAVINSNKVGLKQARLATALIAAELDLNAWLLAQRRAQAPYGGGLEMLERWNEAKDQVEDFWALFDSSPQEWRRAEGLSRLTEVLSEALQVVRGLVPEAMDYQWD